MMPCLSRINILCSSVTTLSPKASGAPLNIVLARSICTRRAPSAFDTLRRTPSTSPAPTATAKTGLSRRLRVPAVAFGTSPGRPREHDDFPGGFRRWEKRNERGGGNALRYGLSSVQGWRGEMEDAHAAAVALPHREGLLFLRRWAFFAVYDGHGGSHVAEHCAEHLLEHLIGNPDFQTSALDEDHSDDESSSSSSVVNAIHAGFLSFDESLRTLSEKHWRAHCGSTAVALLVSPRRLYFINCGDSRAVLSRGGGGGGYEPYFATRDHKPDDPPERERIEQAGGVVILRRVNGDLAVSRALGDFAYKGAPGRGPAEQPVSPEPDVVAIERREDGGEFAVLACDGVWDVMSSEELCAFVRRRLEATDDLERVCDDVVDACLRRGSRDNITVLLVSFSGPEQRFAEVVAL